MRERFYAITAERKLVHPAVQAICETLGRSDDAITALTSVGNIDSAEPSLALWDLGRTVAASPTLMAALDAGTDGLLDRLPLIRTIYGPVSQVVTMLRGSSSKDVEGMSVVLCRFGSGGGASMLALLTSPTVYTLAEGACHLVYLPTSPLPMSGGLTFVPVEAVSPVPEMDVDGLMRIYFSLGALSREVMPTRLVAPSTAGPGC